MAEVIINTKIVLTKRLLNTTFKSLFFVFCIHCSVGQTLAQVNFVDSISLALKKKPKLIATLSTRHAFIDNVSSPIYNVKIGLNFDNVFRLGCGYAFLKKPYHVEANVAGISHPVSAELKFSYVNFFAEYVFNKTNKWEFSVPLFLGIGNSYLKYDHNNQTTKNNRKLVLLYEPVISGHYKVFPWLGVGGDIGYRLMLVNNRSIESKFNSPIYGFRVMFFVGQFFEKVIKPLENN